jgi:hypothetical protein
MTAAVKVPHKHAEAIKAWADGAAIQYRNISGSTWFDIGGDGPAWNLNWEYRVKPGRVYPVTQMTDEDLSQAWSVVPAGYKGLRGFANAALRHAIDANQVITALDHNNALAALDHNLHAARAARDLAIAEAVRDACRKPFESTSMGTPHWLTPMTAYGRVSGVGLAAAIAKALPC